jgi:hypothetical protein
VRSNDGQRFNREQVRKELQAINTAVKRIEAQLGL